MLFKITLLLTVTVSCSCYVAACISCPAKCTENLYLNDSVSYVKLGEVSTPKICTWTLKSPSNTTIVVQINDIQLSGSMDRFISLDGPNETFTAIQQCGVDCSLKGVFMVTSENAMTIVIDLDRTPGLRNVSITAWAQENGGRFNDNGLFNFNNNSDNKAFYQMHSTTDKQIQVNLYDALMHPTSSIKVYDGISDQRPLLANFSDKDQFFPVTASQRDLLLIAENMNGPLYFGGNFSTVQPGCHKVSSGSSAEFKLDRKNFISECDWLINPTESSGTILLEVTSINLCNNETVVIYEGLTTHGQELATLTMETRTSIFPKISAPAKRGLSIYLKSQGTSKKCSSTVFSGSYWIVPDCISELQKTGSLTSPQFPNQYPLNDVCTWTTPPENKSTSLYVTINNLDLTHNNTLTVRNSNRTSVIYTGKDLPSDLVTKVTSDTTASVIFDSKIKNVGTGLEIPGQGFNLSYKVLDCGYSIKSKNGTISTKKDIPANATECIWVVSVPPNTGKNIVNIVSLKINIIGDGNWSNLELRDGGSIRSPVLTEGVSMLKTQTFLTRHNMVWIHYRRNKSEIEEIADNSEFSFSLTFSTYGCSPKDQCKNGICLHPDWKCNGKDDCGDNTDEIGCATVIKGVKLWLTIVIAVICFLIGIVLTIVSYVLYKRYKHCEYEKLKE